MRKIWTNLGQNFRIARFSKTCDEIIMRKIWMNLAQFFRIAWFSKTCDEIIAENLDEFGSIFPHCMVLLKTCRLADTFKFNHFDSFNGATFMFRIMIQ